MKSIKMKGKSAEDAVSTALKVLNGEKDKAKVRIINEGRPGVLGMIGGEEAEVEVTLKTTIEEDAKQVLSEILDKMAMLTAVESEKLEESVELKIKGEDLGRIIGKDGATLKALETLVGSIIGKLYVERMRINIDAGDYKLKRKNALERLAEEIADEVSKTGKEKVMPHMEAWDRRIIHLYIQGKNNVQSHSQGEGRERRLIIAPKS